MTIKAYPNCSVLPWRAAFLAFVAVPKCTLIQAAGVVLVCQLCQLCFQGHCPSLPSTVRAHFSQPALGSDLVLVTQYNSYFLGLAVNFPKQTEWIVL